MKPAKKRNIQLDVLRGVAILLVFGRHLELPRPEGVLGALAEIWFRIGWIGVDLFFVLSGFLIGGLLVTELQKHGRIDVMRFLIRRGLKIYPAYIVFIAYLLFMPTAKAVVHGQGGWTAFLSQWKLCWPNLLFLQNYLWTAAGHTWTLAVEEHFYLLLPFLLVALAATGRIRLLIPICFWMVPVFLLLRTISVWTGDPFSATVSATHLRLDALLFGVGIRGLAQYYPERFQAARHWRPALLLAGILLWSPNLFIDPSTAFIRTVGLTGTFLGSAAFLVAAYQTRASDFGKWSVMFSPIALLLAWIGVYSYAIYLWHVTVIGICEREIGGRLLAWAGGATQPVWLLSVILICAGAVLCGALASKLVEWPVLRLRDRFFPSRSGTLPPEEQNVVGKGRSQPLTPDASNPIAPSDPAKC